MKSGSKKGKGGDSPSQLIYARIKELSDWRGETLAKTPAAYVLLSLGERIKVRAPEPAVTSVRSLLIIQSLSIENLPHTFFNS